MNKGSQSIKNWLLGLFLISISNIWAQNTTSSPYSMFGIGKIENQGIGKSIAMGSAGIALNSEGYLNNLNPASYNGIDSTSAIFELGADFNYSIFEFQDESQNTTTGNFRYLAMGFRLKPWWGTSLGLRPYSSVGYTITTTHELTPDEDYTIEHQGNGGLTQFYWGNSMSPIKGLSLGLNISYLFGAIEQEDRLYLEDENSYTAYTNSRYYFNQVNFEYGILYSLKIKDLKYSLGATYSHKQSLEAEEQKEIIFYTGSTLLDEESGLSDFVVPQSYGIGIAIQKGPNFLLAADFKTQNWSNATSLNTSYALENSEIFNLGVEITPSVKKQSSYLEKVSYRLGGFYHDTYLNIDKTQIKEYAVTCGFGFPIANRRNALNISFQFGQYGGNGENLIMENFGRIHLNYKLNESWFNKPKYL